MDGDLVKGIRIKAMMPQVEFGKELGVTQRTISQWELGAREISLRNQRKIVEFCKNHNIDIDKIKGE